MSAETSNATVLQYIHGLGSRYLVCYDKKKSWQYKDED